MLEQRRRSTMFGCLGCCCTAATTTAAQETRAAQLLKQHSRAGWYETRHIIQVLSIPKFSSVQKNKPTPTCTRPLPWTIECKNKIIFQINVLVNSILLHPPAWKRQGQLVLFIVHSRSHFSEIKGHASIKYLNNYFNIPLCRSILYELTTPDGWKWHSSFI